VGVPRRLLLRRLRRPPGGVRSRARGDRLHHRPRGRRVGHRRHRWPARPRRLHPLVQRQLHHQRGCPRGLRRPCRLLLRHR
jgi:hypothetical protein